MACRASSADREETLYQHRQGFGFIPGSLMVLGVAAMTIGTVFVPLLIVGLIPMLWAAWTFSEFNITVNSSHLEWSFRGGFWHKKVALSEIEQAKPVRNRWWYGWGIHLTPRGWLYNVQGLSAVEVVTKSGHRFRVGTEKPEELAEEIERRRNQLRR